MSDRVETFLSHILEAGRVAWPELAVTADQLRWFVARLDLDRSVAAARHSEILLAAACASSVPDAVAIFERQMMGVIERAVAKLGAANDVADEVKQRVRDIALVAKPGKLPAIASFNGTGPLASWVRIVAMREAYRVLARKGRDVGGDERLAAMLAPADDPELALMKEHYRASFKTAFSTAMASLPKKQRTVLRLSVLDGLSIDEIAPMFDVHRATAARWLADARQVLLRDTKKAMMSELGMAPSEVESVIRLISSRFDMSIAPMLKAE